VLLSCSVIARTILPVMFIRSNDADIDIMRPTLLYLKAIQSQLAARKPDLSDFNHPHVALFLSNLKFWSSSCRIEPASLCMRTGTA